MALLSIGYKPREIEDLQPREIEIILKANKIKEKREKNISAYYISLIINYAGKPLKKILTAKEIFETIFPVKKNKDDKKHFLKVFPDLKERLEKERGIK